MKLILGDCLEELRKLPENSIDSLVTDPPAGISFMCKAWDDDKGGRDQWIAWMTEVMKECLRTLKPGAHGLVWAIPRTSHWTATALEDAGFRIKDCVQHIFGSGFPKSHSCKNIGRSELGSALKPSAEFWWLIQKPLEKGLTIDKNVLKWGTGALQIDASRIRTVRCEETQDKLSVSSVKPNHGLDEVENSKSSVIRNATGSLEKEESIIHSDGLINQGTSDLNIGMTRKESIATSSSIGISGEKKCQLDMLFITETKIDRITGSKISNSCEEVNTANSTAPNQKNIQKEEMQVYTQNDGEQIIQNTNQSTQKICESLEPKGRWPSHTVLSHNPDCVEVGTKKIKTDSHQADKSIGFGERKYNGKENESERKYTETVAAWECTEGCAVAELDRQSLAGGMHGAGKARVGSSNPREVTHIPTSYKLPHSTGTMFRVGDSGGASRFFYCAKPSKREKNAGCEGLPEKESQSTGWSGDSMPLKQDGTETVAAWECTEGCAVAMLDAQSGFSKTPKSVTRNARVDTGKYGDFGAITTHCAGDSGGASRFFYCAKASKSDKGQCNTHPTVKASKLMAYLIKMITLPNGIVLDPFMGSGSTGVAAIKEGFDFIGIEKEPEYYEIAQKRIEYACDKIK